MAFQRLVCSFSKFRRYTDFVMDENLRKNRETITNLVQRALPLTSALPRVPPARQLVFQAFSQLWQPRCSLPVKVDLSHRVGSAP